MSLIKPTVLALVALLASWSGRAASAEQLACPLVNGAHQLYVQVFDGTSDEGAALIADAGDSHHGYWKLAYVYEQGRVATVQCVYKNRETREFVLSKKVSICRYTIDSSGSARVRCR